MVLGVGLLYDWMLQREHLITKDFVDERMAKAQAALAAGQRLSQSAKYNREIALQLFDGQVPKATSKKQSPQDVLFQAEAKWAHVLEERNQADSAYANAVSALDDVLALVPQHAQARELRISPTYERILLAETFYDRTERDRLRRDFERQAAHNPEWLKRLGTPAVLDIKTTPPGVSVEIKQYVVDNETGVRRLEPVSGINPLGKTPVAGLSLPAGSYHLRFQREGSVPVDLPLLLERGTHEQVDLVLPATVPEGYIYVPPGRFLLGSADPERMRKFEKSVPLHSVSLASGYLIGRTEVTILDWMTYIESGDATEGDRQDLNASSRVTAGTIKLEFSPEKRTWKFSLPGPTTPSSRRTPASPFAIAAGAFARNRTGASFP
ncbi:hypothetical protein ACN28S_33205 [Cystobacter fuscus]